MEFEYFKFHPRSCPTVILVSRRRERSNIFLFGCHFSPQEKRKKHHASAGLSFFVSSGPMGEGKELLRKPNIRVPQVPPICLCYFNFGPSIMSNLVFDLLTKEQKMSTWSHHLFWPCAQREAHTVSADLNFSPSRKSDATFIGVCSFGCDFSSLWPFQ